MSKGERSRRTPYQRLKVFFKTIASGVGWRFKESTMKRTLKTVAVLALCLALGGLVTANKARAADGTVSQHMLAQAMLTAHFIAAALKAGMSKDEIDAALAGVAAGSAISEFWISDEKGRVEFTNIPGTGFTFPTDTAAKSQAAPFRGAARRQQERGDSGVQVA